MEASKTERIIRSRAGLVQALPGLRRGEEAAEGGCGVLGFAANIPIPGRHVLAASRQMHNRGNGKGGGIAMAGLDPAQMQVDAATLRSHYLVQVALLDPAARRELETGCLEPYFDIAQAYQIEQLPDYHAVPGLEVRPPDVWRYFVRVKPETLARFAEQNDLLDLPSRSIEDEFIYQNSYRLNQQFYASLGEKRAFVLSHGRNLLVLKIVGYAEDVVDYYCLNEQTAHIWISHQRYPTKGRVWHPGGAHPFIGLNEALVHNGDFANYHSVGEYLRQRNIGQLFLTDTEVSAQLFDLWDRVYGYPLEITLEAMAPTSEHDFTMLPLDKQSLYQAVQRTHIHGSPDGPWFFILARSRPGMGADGDGAGETDAYELLGITDTSMLRPQVFALYENRPSETDAGVQIGLIASERQAINACLRSLSADDERFQPVADRYWVARGGSHTDGGAFRFTVNLPVNGSSGRASLSCRDKFGESVRINQRQRHASPEDLDPHRARQPYREDWTVLAYHACDNGGAATVWKWLEPQMESLGWGELVWTLDWLLMFSQHGEDEHALALGTYNYLRDRRYPTGDKKRASLLRLVDKALVRLFDQAPLIKAGSRSHRRRLTWESRQGLRPPQNGEDTLLIDALGFDPEGDDSAAQWMVKAYQSGWTRQLIYNWRGGRFAGCGFGPDSAEVRIDLYGDVGDYAASGLDGAEVYIHGDGQDQLGQIFKRGRLVIHGDAGQTFLYGAKGGEIYVLGSAAGRPLINAVGQPRVVINGTCLDYLAESFMAGDPLQDGGFVILNGVAFDEDGRLEELASPYPGGNLFSLASGGAIYLRDPRGIVQTGQLNGGAFTELSPADWELISPYLLENERLFGIRVEDLLRLDGSSLPPQQIYRKVEVHAAKVI
jgi:glutamate synthase domain-containing protein 1